MLVANCVCTIPGVDVRQLFNNNFRGKKATFGIQNIADVGLKQFNVLPGEWYGINQMSQVMEILNYQFTPIETFSVCTFQDGGVDMEYVYSVGTSCLSDAENGSGESFHSGQSAGEMDFQ